MENSIRIRNIHFGELTKISYDKRTSDEKWIHLSIESPEMPMPEFRAALQAIADDIVKIRGREPHEAGIIDVIGATFTYKEANDYSVIVKTKREIKMANSPEIINGPLFKFSLIKEGDDDYEWALSFKERLADFMHFAERYINGER